ncbi:MAG: 30S ribosomal protein S6 [Candidatus Brocadiales bacterium]
MKTYEAMFLIDNARTSDWDKVVEHVHGILKKGNARVLSTEKWAERKLAYRIDGHKRGTYMLVYFDAPAGAITDIRRDCQLSDAILRCLILKVEKRPEPAAEGPVEESLRADEKGKSTEGTEEAAAKE